MAEYPYTLSPSKIQPFFEKLTVVATPDKVTQTWLETIGFKAKADRNLTSILKGLRFSDGNGVPTQLWISYRGGDKSALATGIKSAYAPFYSTYPSAHDHSNTELENIIKSTSPKSSHDLVTRIVSTYRALVKMADFSGSTASGSQNLQPSTPSSAPKEEKAVSSNLSGLGREMVINLNVQLTLPETTDADVYAKLFKAMREHLLDASS